jgi:DNA-binding LacI/PurR family transcriptional regulator
VEHSTAVEPVQQPLALQGAEVPAHGHLRGADERGEVLVAGRDSMPCLTDELALGVMRRAWERGVRVPDDLAVVGFDDIEDGRYARPSLTTVSPDKRALADVAVDRLLALVGGSVQTARSTITPHRLVVRESSG